MTSDPSHDDTEGGARHGAAGRDAPLDGSLSDGSPSDGAASDASPPNPPAATADAVAPAAAADTPAPDSAETTTPSSPAADPSAVDAHADVPTMSDPPSMADFIADALRRAPRDAEGRRRPLSGREIVDALEARGDSPVQGHEGSVYAILLEMRRDGRADAGWRQHARGRRFVYALPGALPPDNVAPDSALPPDAPADEAIVTTAERCVSRLAFAPRLREELRAELIHHLKDKQHPPEVTAASGNAGSAAAAATDAGADSALDDSLDTAPAVTPPSPPPAPAVELRRAASLEALAGLGDPWKISVELSRAARGLTIAPFPRSAAEGFRSAWIYDAPVLGLIVFVILFIRIQVISAYHIPSKSMEPTFHGDIENGDRILVLHWMPPPGLFDTIVFDGWRAERKHFVKRCVGTPGSTVRFREGDLWIDGRLVRKDGSDLDALLFPLFDLAAERRVRTDAPSFTSRMETLWHSGGGARWTLDDSGTFEGWNGETAATLRWDSDPMDKVYDTRTCVYTEDGRKSVADLRVTWDVTPADDTSRITLRLGRGAQFCDAVLGGPDGGVSLVVDGVRVEYAEEVSLPPGETHRVRFSRVDHVLRLEIDGELVLRHDLEAPDDPKRDAPSGSVSAIITAGSAKLAPVALERDVYWTSDYGEDADVKLGPDEFFMAGDNSSNSSDSRSRGPVHRSRLVGRPLLIVWPFSRFGVPK